MVLTLLALEAIASKVHMKEVPLATVLEASSLVVVVEPATPAWKEWTLSSPGQTPPYIFRTQRLSVVEVLRDSTSTVKKGLVLDVAHGSLADDHHDHVEYHRIGLSVSRVVHTYATPFDGATPAPTSWIAMLRPCTEGAYSGYCYTVNQAMERVENRALVTQTPAR